MQADTLQNRRFVLDPRAAADLRVRLKSDPQSGLKEAAQQFESMMLQMMLKSMREATSQDGLTDSDQTRFYTSILDQQLSQDLSGKGALGFAKLIERQFGRSSGADGLPSSATASPMELMQQSLLSRQAAISAGQLGNIGAARNRGVNPLVPADEGAGNTQEFVNRLWPHALEAANSLAVPPQFLVAHAALESGWGKSEIRTADGRPSYNLFGVKAGRSWSGAAAEVRTTEYVNGEAQSTVERFRVYGSYAEAFRDYANLLKGSVRFSAAVGQQDGTRFARSLQQGGYATDPAYADKLSRIINGAALRQALAG